MKKKYKIKYKTVFIIIFVILVLFCCVRFYSKGYTVTYKVGKEKYEVTEIYTKNASDEINNYYIEIISNQVAYGFQFYHRFSKKRKVVEDIITYDGEYQCVLPIIGGKAESDLLCYKDYRYYFYNTIIGKESNLDKFVSELDDKIYDKNNWIDDKEEEKKENNIVYYPNNKVENHVFSITNLKGIYQLLDGIKEIFIFDKDIYQRDLSTFLSRYYVTADYEEKQQFRNFYIIDMINGKVETIKAPNYISFDSYIQGIVDNKIYIYDKDNEKQYMINPKEKTVKEVGNNKKKIKYYEQNKWEKITTTKANKNLTFNLIEEELEFQKYDEVYHVGGEVSGYYYLLEKQENGYYLYRTPSQNKKMITYISTVNDTKNIYLLDDYVYFLDGQFIKYYHDTTGVRTLLEYRELEFNKNIIFGVAKN